MRVSIEIMDAPDTAAELRTAQRVDAQPEGRAYDGGSDQMAEPSAAEPGEPGAEGRGPGGPPLPGGTEGRGPGGPPLPEGAEGRGPGGPPLPDGAEVHDGGAAPVAPVASGTEARPPSPPREPPLQIEEPYGNGHRG